MVNDWIAIRLPGWRNIGRYALWGTGRVTFSLWFFSLYGVKTLFVVGIKIIEMTERATFELLKVYNQLPYMGTLGQAVIDTTAIAITEPGEVITDLMQSLIGKHALIVGDTGTGKSTVAQWLAYQVSGEITVYDPDAAPEEWAGLKVIGRQGNFNAIREAMTADLEELQRRIEVRGASGDKALLGLDSVLIAEEFPLLKDEIDIASKWLIKHAQRGRKPKRFIIALAQDDTVKSFGIEGEGGVRKNFRMVRLGKFAVTHAKTLKDTALVEWLKAAKYRCMVDDVPCQLPDLSSYKMVMPRLQASEVLPTTKTTNSPSGEGFQALEAPVIADDVALSKAAKACLAAGLSESTIIKEILGYPGSQYQKGKTLLQKIKGEEI